MADDESSELSSVSSLSSAPPSDDEGDVQLERSKGGILNFFHKLPKGQKPSEPDQEPSPPPRRRSPSPPHEYVLADNTDIAFIVMFRSRFNEAFPKSLANFGPQELERDVSEPVPGERVEHFLCACLGLLLNRKQDVKPGHYNRALEDAISSHKSQWPKEWQAKNPLSGGTSFVSMSPTERLLLLRTLILWTMSSSEVVKTQINKSYRQNRHEDDLNQPLSVQPWGQDSDKRRYFLIEGLDDTNFRVYRESNPQGLKRTWWSVAGSLDELKSLVDKLETVDGGPRAKKLAARMSGSIPRFEATEEKRRRREYRLQQKERFKRPEPGFSMYEGRTRGKRMKYTYSDDEEFLSDSTGRRSLRNTGTNTPAEPAGPMTTASGRQIKAPSRMTVDADNNLVTTSTDQDQDATRSRASPKSFGDRPRRSAASRGYNSMDEEMADDEDASEPDLGDDEEDHVPDVSDEEDEEFDEDEEMEDDDLNEKLQSLIVTVKIPTKATIAEAKPSISDNQPSHDDSDSKIPTTSKPSQEGDETQQQSEHNDAAVDDAVSKVKKEAIPTPDEAPTNGTAHLEGDEEGAISAPTSNPDLKGTPHEEKAPENPSPSVDIPMEDG